GKSSESFYKQRKQALAKFVDRSSRGGGTSIAITKKIEQEVAIGFPTDVIVEKSKENVDLIIMGGTGMTNSIHQPFGSVASHVAQKAHCPVLIIPQHASFAGFRNILFASHHDSVKPNLLQKAIRFSRPFGSKLHFIHVQTAKAKPNLNIELEDNLFRFLFEKGSPDFPFNLASIDAPTTEKGLNQYIKENEIDLAFLVTHHRNFWERLFHQSVTKEMTIHTSTPILILHDDDN
ncbi:MAG: universal stress protein, partial [Saprospiraceae bacterium]